MASDRARTSAAVAMTSIIVKMLKSSTDWIPTNAAVGMEGRKRGVGASGRETVRGEPSRIGRCLRRVVLDVGIVLPALGSVGHVVEVIIAGHGLRLEDEIPGFTRHLPEA